MTMKGAYSWVFLCALGIGALACKRGPSHSAVMTEETASEAATSTPPTPVDRQAWIHAEAAFEILLGRLPTFAELERYAASSRGETVNRLLAAFHTDARLGQEYQETFTTRVTGFIQSGMAALVQVAATGTRGGNRGAATAYALTNSGFDPQQRLSALFSQKRIGGAARCGATEAPQCFRVWLATWVGCEQEAQGESYEDLIKYLALNC